MIKRTFKDVEHAVIATGAVNKYQTIDGVIHFSSKAFTDDIKKQLDKEARKNLDVMVNSLSKEINKHIVDRICKTKFKKIVKKI